MIKNKFVYALQNNSISEMQSIPKSELHSHAGRGGNISYIERWANIKINTPITPFSTLSEMNQWLNDNIKCYCPSGVEGYLLRVEAAFAQASEDNVQVLALSYGMDEIAELGGMNNFIKQMSYMHQKFAPKQISFRI